MLDGSGEVAYNFHGRNIPVSEKQQPMLDFQTKCHYVSALSLDGSSTAIVYNAE